MPRASEIVRLTASEENTLTNRGYEISAKLGEGAYAKVSLLNAFLGIDRNFCSLTTGIPE